MIHVQHLLGVGHFQRALSLATALDAAGYEVIVASGGMPVSGSLVGRIKLFQLAPMRSQDGYFKTLLDEQDRPIDDCWRESRRIQLLELFHQFKPRVLITETFPFGRRMLRFELLPLLEVAKAHPDCQLIISSIRDILQPKSSPV